MGCSTYFGEWTHSGRKGKRQIPTSIFSHLWIRLVTTQMNRNLAMITLSFRKYITKPIGKHNQDSETWNKFSRSQDQGLQFWQPKSSAIVTHDIVPGDGIRRVISQNGDQEDVESNSKEVATKESRAGSRDETRDATGVEKTSGNSCRTASKVDVASDVREPEVSTDAPLKNEANTQEIKRVKIGSNKTIFAKTWRKTR